MLLSSWSERVFRLLFIFTSCFCEDEKQTGLISFSMKRRRFEELFKAPPAWHRASASPSVRPESDPRHQRPGSRAAPAPLGLESGGPGSDLGQYSGSRSLRCNRPPLSGLSLEVSEVKGQSHALLTASAAAAEDHEPRRPTRTRTTTVCSNTASR